MSLRHAQEQATSGAKGHKFTGGGFSFLSKSLAVFGKLVAMCKADERKSLFPDD